MTFNEYQDRAGVTALYQDKFYPIASLMVESAELSDLFIKPMLRGDNKQIDRHDIVSEAGDVLWNLAMLLRDSDIDFSEVAEYNLSKLQSRADRGVIQGSGGDR
jgi:NTP pyrophosphatase (non-canonical NTP hydrolase)